MTIYNANVAYNYQKNPDIVLNTKSQTAKELTAVLRNVSSTNQTRNIFNVFPTNAITPVYGAGAPAISSITLPDSLNTVKYAGKQVSGMGVN